MERKHVYADGLDQITFLEGLVRLDFFCAGEEAENGEISREHVGRLLLPPNGFLSVYEAMGQLIARMEQAGLVERNEPGAPASGSDSENTTFSPNFM